MAKSKKNDEFEELDDFDLDETEAEVEEDAEEYEEEDTISDDVEEAEVSEEDSETEELTEAFQESGPVVEEDIVGDKSKKAKWYVIHTYSGHENKVKVNIEKIVENRGMQDLVLSVIVPTEDHVEIKNGPLITLTLSPGSISI